MKYTYRDECFFRDRTDIKGFCVMAFWFFVTFLIFLMDPYLIIFKGGEGMGSFLVGMVFSVILLMLAATMYRGISKRRRKALEMRHLALKTGVRCDGRIVDAGMETEAEECETTDDYGNRKMENIYIPNYWIDVEYFIAGSGEVKRFHAIHFSKHMKRFIGCGVDVYMWNKWSEFEDKELTMIYVDTGRLN